MQTLTLIPIGHDPRMDLVKSCIRGKAVIQELSPDVFFEDIPAAPETGFAPLLFLAAVDDLGMGEDFVRVLRRVRALGDGLRGYAAGVILLGSTELDTKNAARELIFALDMAGCAFPERPLAEATGSMRNLRVTQRTHALNDPEEALAFSVESLADRLLSFAPPRFAAPRLLVLHASDRPTSNTLALGDLVLERLDKRFSIRTLSLRNGTIEDCRGCAYTVCSHFASKGSCFYGGSISQEVIPAVQDCDGLLLLLPNYNDAVGANIMAFINRLGLQRRRYRGEAGHGRSVPQPVLPAAAPFLPHGNGQRSRRGGAASRHPPAGGLLRCSNQPESPGGSTVNYCHIPPSISP